MERQIISPSKNDIIHLLRAHSDERPFCSAPQCACHQDEERIIRYVLPLYNEGLISEGDAIRIIAGQQLP